MRTDAHRWLGCVGFSHGIHRIHRSFWRRRASHGFHRCTQIFLLRQSFLCVPRILWEDSFVAAWVWQGCHTLLICAICGRISCVRNFCAICGRIFPICRFCVPRILWEDSLVAAWVWQGCHTLLICAHPCNLWENILRQKFFAICGRIVMLVPDCFVGAAETAAPPCRMQKVH